MRSSQRAETWANLKKFKTKFWKRKKKRRKQNTEKEDHTEKHTPTGKQPTDTLGKDYSPLI